MVIKPHYDITTNMKLIRREDKPGSPQSLQVVDSDPDNNYLIRVLKDDGTYTFMHKYTLQLFYQPQQYGRQGVLFTKPPTIAQRLFGKYFN